MVDWSGRVVPFQDELAERYRAAGLWGDLPIAAELRVVAERFAERDAVVAPEGRLTYAELDDRADRVAVGLVDLGIAPGDRVVLQLTNRLETIVLWYGLLKAGAIPVCTLAAHRGHEIGEISRRTQAVAHVVEADAPRFDFVGFAHEQREGHPTLRYVVTVGGPGGDVTYDELAASADTARRELVDRIQQSLDPLDVAVFQLSGGTTGVPKVIPRSHAEYWYNARAYAEAWGWDETTRNGHLIPIVHNAGIVCGVHGPHSVGGCLLLATADLDRGLAFLADHGVTDVLLGHGHYAAPEHPDFERVAATLRTVVLSGAKVPDRLFERLERLGLWSGQLFGMGEGFFATTRLDAPREARLTTVGTALSDHDEVRVLDPGSERDVPSGEVGELACRGPYTLPGYFDAPEHNARAFTSDGFYRTGDLVAVRSFDGSDYLSVEGRIKDVINRGGEKVSAEEVELLLMRHPGVAAVAVVGMPDPRLGERSCAYLVAAREPLTLGEVQAHLDGLGVAKFKWPERLEWVDELPKTPVGKIDKKRLGAAVVELLRAEGVPVPS